MSRKPKTDRAGVHRRVLLVDRHALMRHAVANTINRCSGLEICGMAGSAAHAFDAVNRLQPDIVVSEIMRPHDLRFIQELHRRHRRLPILVFSFRDEEAYAPRTLEAGARGYLMKNVDGDTLVAGIRKALGGQIVLSRFMAARMRRDSRAQCSGELPSRQARRASPDVCLREGVRSSLVFRDGRGRQSPDSQRAAAPMGRLPPPPFTASMKRRLPARAPGSPPTETRAGRK